MLKRYCAWHLKLFGKELLIGEVPSERDDITHGICPECYKIWEKEVGAYFGDTLKTKSVDAFNEQQL